MAGVTWQTRDGHKILYADYRTNDPDEQLAILEEVGKLVQSSPSGVRNLSDFRDSPIGPAFMKRAKELNATVFDPREMRLALLGIEGLKAILLKGFNAVSKSKSSGVPFSSEAEAYKYLLG